MGPLAANLKHLYQYRFLWMFHLVLAIALSSLFIKMIKVETSEFPIALTLMMFTIYGEMISIAMAGTSAKLFSFCLPNHAREIKKMLLAIWLMITIVCLLILSMLYAFNIHIDSSLFIGSMGLMSLSFWLGVSMFIRKLLSIPLFIAILAFLLIIFKDVDTTLLLSIANHPWIITLSSGILSYSIYHAIGTKTNHRRLCALPSVGFLPANKSKPIRINQELIYRNGVIFSIKTDEFFGNYFTEQIRSNRQSGLLPYLWGQVHLIITPIFSRWKLIWFLLLGSYTLLIIPPCFIIQIQEPESYMFDTIMLIFFSLASSFFCTHQRFKNFLLPGRTIHFFQGIVVLLTTMLLTLGFLGASILLCNFLSTIFPKVTLMGNSFTMVSIPWILLIIPFILVPFFGGLFVLFRGITLLIALAVTAVFTIIVSSFAFPPMETTPFILNLLNILFAAAVTWGFHLAALYYTSMKRSLC